MPSNAGPGQQASPSADQGDIPITRSYLGIATRIPSAPNKSRPVSDGTINKAKPVANSRTAASLSKRLIAFEKKGGRLFQTAYVASASRGG